MTPFKYNRLFSLILFLLMLTSCNKNEPQIKLIPTDHYGEKPEYEQREQLLLHFVQAKLTNDDGSIYTNYVDSEQNSQVATGHEVLSESMGLAMRYYARAGLQQPFQMTWSALLNQLNMEDGFSYRYSDKFEQKYTVNAAIDDLRIIRALFEAAEQFNDNQYKELGEELGARFLTYNSKDERLFDFYDNQYKLTNNFITLCYIDLLTLKLIDSKKEQGKLYQAMLNITKKGYISDQFPFYETRFIYDKEMYQSEEINTIESLLTILHLVEVDEHQPSSIEFIKQQVENGELVGRYSREGVPLTDVQSTAIYAIAAMIGSELGDEHLYEASINRMEQFQILQTEHELYGAYGNLETRQAYSFDNLQALLSYTY